MSVQFGRWNFDGQAADHNYLAKVRKNLAPYGPDGQHIYPRGGTQILYFPFHTTKESWHETQPHISVSGRVFTWDGRLDNRAELMRDLAKPSGDDVSDIAIVADAYGKWGAGCFARIVGDWALAVWDPQEHKLTLAKDFLGSRHLYYSIAETHITWSTVLDPLVLFAEKAFGLNEEYIAGWLSFFPATDLTPYVGIFSVPASCSVDLTQTSRHVRRHWISDPEKQIHYRADAEYEEHFRTVFAEAIRRRLRSAAPVLAELSGGMDSSAIVCMADRIIAQDAADIPRLETVSYYSNAEPNWNERPYFTSVEQQRGRSGCHIDVTLPESAVFRFENDRFVSTPGTSRGQQTGTQKQLEACMRSSGHRVLLSGIGGDEVLGGVPNPIPELRDLLPTAHAALLANRLKLWALDTRRPWLHLLFEAIQGFLPGNIQSFGHYKHGIAWLDARFAKRHADALSGYMARIRFLGPCPSFQENLLTLAALQRQFACSAIPREPLHEKRYPILDRDLLEFIYAIPREQILRPGERRSLMRRALAGIVPVEILKRKRKAFVSRGPIISIASDLLVDLHASHEMVSASLGIVDAAAFARHLRAASTGKEANLVPLMRTVQLEHWLRQWKRFAPVSHENRQAGSGRFASELATPLCH